MEIDIHGEGMVGVNLDFRTHGNSMGASITNCFVMRLDVNEGIAKVPAFVLDTPETNIVAKGKIDFLNEKVDIYINPISKEDFGAKGVCESRPVAFRTYQSILSRGNTYYRVKSEQILKIFVWRLLK
jgi:hypothetical protein